MQSDTLSVVLDPENGGKIRSFRSQKSGFELFFQDFRARFDGHKGYSYHDISGYDECFPNVAPCANLAEKHGGAPLADHGYLWQRNWQAEVHGDAVVLSAAIPELACRLERTCILEDAGTLKLTYGLTNDGQEPVPYVYSAHPLLAATEQTRLELPASLKNVYIYLAAENFGIPNHTWATLPLSDPRDLVGPYDRAKATFVKLFSEKLSEGWATVHHLDSRESLTFRFDPLVLPHLGILVSQGHDSLKDGVFKGQFLLGIEPTTGIGDDLPTCQATGTLRELAPGAELRFWIRLTLNHLN